jgi:hypothetical protein
MFMRMLAEYEVRLESLVAIKLASIAVSNAPIRLPL